MKANVEVGVAGPYPVSYRSIVPAAGQAENLLVPVCLSATHIAYGSIRMEPVFMILGPKRRDCRSLAIDTGTSVQHVDYAGTPITAAPGRPNPRMDRPARKEAAPATKLDGRVLDDTEAQKTANGPRAA